MIFITLGSQKFQFNRLLKEIDRLVGEGKISEGVFAQIGYSDYKPKNYRYNEFLDREKFIEIIDKCDKVITHGGTGAIITAVKSGKKVIAIPRLAKYGEHVDDHQLQITKQFSEMNLIIGIKEISDIEESLKLADIYEFNSYISNTNSIIREIEKFIKN